MKKKSKKLPRLFGKSYSEKALERKILRRIHIPKDRKMVKDLFSKDDKGKWFIDGEIPEETNKTLKVLAKAIKKNKGVVTTWKAALVVIPLALIILFNILFKNQLAERAAESALRNLFEAEVDIDELKISLLKGSVSFLSLSIADKDNPKRNLLESGPGLVEIKTSELAFKRFHIDEISLLEVGWNTLRSVDGSLGGEEGDEGEDGSGDGPADKDGGASAPLMDLAGDFDYQSLLESRKDDLKSLKLIEDTNAQISSLTDNWSGKLEEKEAEITSLKNRISSFQSIDAASLSNPAEIQSLITEIGSLKDEVKSFKNSVSQLNRDFSRDKDSVASVAGNLTSAVESDLAFLGESLDFSAGGFKSLAADLAEEFIRSRWNSYYEGGLKAWSLYNKFRGDREPEEEEKKGINRAAGRTVLFPSPDKPLFYLHKVQLTGEDGSFAFDFNLASISSEPEKVDRPISLDLSIHEGSVAVTGTGYLDMRQSSDQLFFMDVNGEGIPVELPEGISGLGISRLNSEAGLSGELSSQRDSGLVKSQMDIALDNLAIEQSGSGGFLNDAVATVFRNNDSLELTGIIEVSGSGIESVDVDTDFDRILNDSVGAYLADLEKKALDELEAGLMDFLNPALGENELLSSGLEQLGIQSAGQISSVGNLESILDGKIGELEKQTDSLAESVLQKATDSIKLPGF